MAVKIIIERTVKAEKEAEVVELLKELRVRAIRQPGYVSGETLISMEQPCTHLVISNWQTRDSWKAWTENPKRKKINDMIEKYLTAPTRVKIYTELPGGLAEGV